MNGFAFGRWHAAFDRLDLEFGYRDGARITADFRWFHRSNAWLYYLHIRSAWFAFQQWTGLVFDAGFADFASFFGQADFRLFEDLLLEADFRQLAGANLKLGSFDGGALWDALGFWDSDGARIAGVIYVLGSVTKTDLRNFYGRWRRAVLETRIHFIFRHCGEALLEVSKTIEMTDWVSNAGSSDDFSFFQGNSDCSSRKGNVDLQIHGKSKLFRRY